MRGPTFAKVFEDTPGFGYSEQVQARDRARDHLDLPDRVDDFNSIPKFDGNDYFLGTNQINYALVQRLLAKRPGPSGKLEPYEFLTWRADADLLRADRRRPEQLRPQLLVLRASGPAACRTTSRRSPRA